MWGFHSGTFNPEVPPYDHHWPTSQGSHVYHTCSVWTSSFYLWREQSASCGPASSNVFYLWKPVELQSAGLWVRSEPCTWVTSWRLFCRALAVFPLFLLDQRSRYPSCCWIDNLRVAAHLLVSPPHWWETVLGDTANLSEPFAVLSADDAHSVEKSCS